MTMMNLYLSLQSTDSIQYQHPQQKKEQKEEKFEILVQKLIEDNPSLTFEDWSSILFRKTVKIKFKNKWTFS